MGICETPPRLCYLLGKTALHPVPLSWSVTILPEEINHTNSSLLLGNTSCFWVL